MAAAVQTQEVTREAQYFVTTEGMEFFVTAIADGQGKRTLRYAKSNFPVLVPTKQEAMDVAKLANEMAWQFMREDTKVLQWVVGRIELLVGKHEEIIKNGEGGDALSNTDLAEIQERAEMKARLRQNEPTDVPKWIKEVKREKNGDN